MYSDSLGSDIQPEPFDYEEERLSKPKGKKMPSIQIQIIAVSNETKMNKANKPYNMLEVTYKNLTFQGKTESKKILSFGAQESTYKDLVDAQNGQVFDCNVVKNDAGFNDWVSVAKGDASAPQGNAASGKAANTPTRSTYETPEERAARQILIVRQSSLSSAVATLTTGAKSPPSPDDIEALAQRYSDFVFQVGSEPSLDSLGDDIPF